jgi:hypothetical protein
MDRFNADGFLLVENFIAVADGCRRASESTYLFPRQRRNKNRRSDRGTGIPGGLASRRTRPAKIARDAGPENGIRLFAIVVGLQAAFPGRAK